MPNSKGPAFFSKLPGWLLAMLVSFSSHSAQPQTVIQLDGATPVVDLSSASTMWVDPSSQATILQVTRATARSAFKPTSAETVYALGHQNALWLHFRFAPQADSKEDWVLEFPQPLIDRVTVYQLGAAGTWTGQVAGDTVAVSRWPEPGRYPQFRLTMPRSGVSDVYVQVRNVSNIALPVRLQSVSSEIQHLQKEYLLVGVVFGTLLLLTLTCLTQSLMYRDRVYGWYAAYASLLTLTMAAWTGVAGHMIWNDWAVWNDLAPGCLGVLTGSAALVFVTHLCGANARQPWFEPTAYALGMAGLPITLAYALMDRQTAVVMISIYLISVALLGLYKAAIRWRREDAVGLWTLIAFAPITLATVLLVASVMGFIASSWLSRYGLMIGLIVEVPLLLIALNLRARQRHSVESRAQAMVSQDALTGLLTAHLFNDRLIQTVARAKRHKEPAALVYIELVNYGYIKKTWGVAVAEQSLLRSVIKLRRILRDVDTVGRVDEARFGLVLEGIVSRQPIIEMAARLIAAGLMPLKGLKPEVVLQFHVAAVLLTERMGGASELGRSLSDLMVRMGARTRRPIRFLEPELTTPMPLEALSEFEPSLKNSN